MKHIGEEVDKSYPKGFFDYKIIIPQEEPKQDCKHDIVTKYGVAECQNCGMEESEIVREEPKQESLEEAAERLYPTTIDSFTDTGIDMSETERLIFINGAKWQAERMYSEEEVRKISLDFFYHWWNSKGTNTEQGFKEWFEQFKNK